MNIMHILFSMSDTVMYCEVIVPVSGCLWPWTVRPVYLCQVSDVSRRSRPINQTRLAFLSFRAILGDKPSACPSARRSTHCR